METARTITTSEQDVLGLSKEGLDFSKSGLRHPDVIPDVVSLRDILRSLDEQLRRYAILKNLQFSVRLDCLEHDTIETDGSRLKQILRHLTSNAIKYTDCGSVSLTVRRLTDPVDVVYFNSVGEDGFAFTVTDTGAGIPADKRELIFNDFQRETGLIEPEYRGLGLSICREYTRLLGGAIHFTSTVGKGSCFTLYLPRQFGRFSATSSPVTVSPPIDRGYWSVDRVYVDDLSTGASRKRVLVVAEADPVFGKLLCSLANEQGFQCVATDNADCAYKKVMQLKPEAIVLDVTLVGGDGWTLFERIKDTPSLRHIPIQFVSAQNDLYNAMEKGAIGFLKKPVGIEELQRVFNRFIYLNYRDVARLLIAGNSTASSADLAAILAADTIDIARCPITDLHETIADEYFDCVLIDVANNERDVLSVLDSLENACDITPPPLVIYCHSPLSSEAHVRLLKYSGLVIKECFNVDNMVDDVTLFLHSVTDRLSPRQQNVIFDMHMTSEFLTDKKVLIVDDDMRNISTLSKSLKNYGLDVIVAADGGIAVELLDRYPDISIVLVDIMMPEYDGFEAIRRIRRREDMRRLPIIALTARANPEVRYKSLIAGANDYLAKPVDTNRLIMTMRVWMQQSMEKS